MGQSNGVLFKGVSAFGRCLLVEVSLYTDFETDKQVHFSLACHCHYYSNTLHVCTLRPHLSAHICCG